MWLLNCLLYFTFYFCFLASDIPRMVIIGLKDKLVPLRSNRRFLEDIGNSDETNHFIYEGKNQENLKCINKVNT